MSLRIRRYLTPAWWCLLLLIVQNVTIFWYHYAGQANFLNDFTRIYYPMTAFWMELVKNGVFPEWLPYQNMGFPFVLTMQSGVFYLPLWIFAISDNLDYTLRAANIMQVLHVLFGAAGCWYYLRLLGLSRVSALFGAVAFQFFGGFYSNAEHADIIRAFAWLPWLFLVVHVLEGEIQLARRHLFMPLVIMLFVCGAYQANVFSQLFFLTLYCLIQCLMLCLARPWQRNTIMALYARMFALGLLGLGLASVYLLPIFELKDFLARNESWMGRSMGWSLIYWNSLFMPLQAGGVYMFTSMISAFVTQPVFYLLFLVNRPVIQACRPWALLTPLAIVMAMGNDTPVYHWLTQVFPFLGYSRFPSSDYRGIFCLGLIILTACVLDMLCAGKIQLNRRQGMLCVALLGYCTLCSFAIAAMQDPANISVVEWIKEQAWASALVSALLFPMTVTTRVTSQEWLLVLVAALIMFVCLRHIRSHQRLVVGVIFAIEMASGGYYLDRTSGDWHILEPANQFLPTLDFEQPLPVVAEAQGRNTAQPACIDPDFFEESWRGYLEGRYLCRSHDTKTRPREQVHKIPELGHLMRQPWQAHDMDQGLLNQCKPDVLLDSKTLSRSVKLLSYSLQQRDYEVHASRDFCFVENKMYFPGWSGTIAGSSGIIEPQAYCSAVRSWCLPAGDYNFTASYRTPGLRTGAIVSLLFLATYVVVAWSWWRRRNT